MRRLRWTLVFLGLGIALPTALIVQRALTSLELENAVRHEAVAERVFDEMERVLSDWLDGEELRPAEDYDSVGGRGPSRSNALILDAETPFVLGRFVVEARGVARIQAVRPGDEARIQEALNETWGAFARAKKEDDTEGAGDRLEEAESRGGGKNAIPAPGSTRSIGKRRVDPQKLASVSDDKDSEASAYDVLQNLNRAPQLRAERKSRAFSPAIPPETIEEAIDEAKAAPARAVQSPAPFELDSRKRDLEGRSAEPGRPPASAIVDFEATNIDPLVGRAAAAGDLVLARSVWRAGSVERQGIVLERQALIAWLEERVLAETGLGDRARMDFDDRAVAPADAALHGYLHRFAEPFDALTARLDLEALPGIGSARPIYALALLLGLVATLGLYAVHRMAGVVVDYAERRSNFVAAVSHELKTPLTSIRMYGEMLRDGLVSGEHKRDEYYATIADESERLSRLIENVLEFSRLEKADRGLNVVVGDLSDAIRGACDKLRTHVEREGFGLRVVCEEDLPAAAFDRDAVTQLVFNLVDNALKYARRAEQREIEVELARAGGRVELRVRDTGPGVPEQDLHRIFEPFYRVGEEMTRTSTGTGIGLALVKQLAEGMHARVRGRNLEGGGFEVAVAFACA
jgi:signal transduction histidine kinase